MVLGIKENGNIGTMLGLGAFALASLLLIWYIVTKPAAIDRSIIGLKGFAHVAKKQGELNIRFFEGNGQINKKQTGFRVLPLYDPNIFTRTENSDESDANKNETLRSMPEYVFAAKIKSLPTLVILPKWREGVSRLEKLHPELLISLKSMRLPYKGSDKLDGPDIRRGEAVLSVIELDDIGADMLPGFVNEKLSLYAPQIMRFSTLGTPNCKPMVSSGLDVILARCYFRSKNKGLPFWLLSDPDIINNHGATNGNNFLFSLALLKTLSNGKPIIIDATARSFMAAKQSVKKHNRSLSDLARFFAYPFSLFWAALIGVVFFTLWHAWRRSGPIVDREQNDAMHASKATAIEANVAILRGSGKKGGNDIPLARVYISQRMEALGAALFGSNRKIGATGDQQIYSALKRRNSVLSNRLSEVRGRFEPSTRILKTTVGSRTLFNDLNDFETALKEVRHEFERTSNPR